jgi:DNA-binding transcriptional LysR family regulator
MISDPYQWAQIDLRHLVALQAIAETGSFGRAAILVGYTQSAISQQIARLEAIVGERLIERSRGPRPIMLTEPGRMLAHHAKTIVAQLRAAHADVAAYRAGEVGILRVGTYQSVGTRLLPIVLRSFGGAWSRVEIQLTEDPRDERLLALVASGDLDLAFTAIPMLEGPFAGVELMRDPWMLLLSRDMPLAEKAEGIVLQDLIDQPMIGYRECRSTTLLEAYIQRQGVTLNTIFRSDDNGTVRGLVAAGMGAALAPQLALEPDPRVVVRSLDGMIPPRIIGLAWHRDRYRSPAAEAFIEVARQCSRTFMETYYDEQSEKTAVDAVPER